MKTTKKIGEQFADACGQIILVVVALSLTVVVVAGVAAGVREVIERLF